MNVLVDSTEARRMSSGSGAVPRVKVFVDYWNFQPALRQEDFCIRGEGCRYRVGDRYDSLGMGGEIRLCGSGDVGPRLGSGCQAPGFEGSKGYPCRISTVRC